VSVSKVVRFTSNFHRLNTDRQTCVCVCTILGRLKVSTMVLYLSAKVYLCVVRVCVCRVEGRPSDIVYWNGRNNNRCSTRIYEKKKKKIKSTVNLPISFYTNIVYVYIRQIIKIYIMNDCIAHTRFILLSFNVIGSRHVCKYIIWYNIIYIYTLVNMCGMATQTTS